MAPTPTPTPDPGTAGTPLPGAIPATTAPLTVAQLAGVGPTDPQPLGYTWAPAAPGDPSGWCVVPAEPIPGTACIWATPTPFYAAGELFGPGPRDAATAADAASAGVEALQTPPDAGLPAPVIGGLILGAVAVMAAVAVALRRRARKPAAALDYPDDGGFR